MTTWDLYFASLVAFTLHPGYQREGAERPSLADCAELTDQMMEHRSKRQWVSLQQQ